MEMGLSPNACNQHGESLVHTVCRHSNIDHFRVLLELGVDVQQTDDYGRTAMHDACWASTPCFEIARELLRRDSSVLFLYDIHGSVPLSYCTKKNWAAWNSFLAQIVDELFPIVKAQNPEVSPLFAMEPNSRPVPDPKKALSVEIAKKIASGDAEIDDPDDTGFDIDNMEHLGQTDLDEEESADCDDDDSVLDSRSLRDYLKRNDSVVELLKDLDDD